MHAEASLPNAGALLANSICPWLIQQVYTHDDVIDFRGLFEVPLIAALCAAVLLAVAFRPPVQTPAPAAAAEPA